MDSMQPVIGESPLLNEALDHLSSLATIDRPVLVTGERGTGKEIAASRLHFLSSRWQAPFIKLNCASLPESLLDSELFGYEPGAFTGARKSHAGRFERAHTGTLFLDEVGTMPTALQEKLLRVIEYGELERIGGNETRSVDVRIVAATNANLPEMASRGAFRWDLLDRLTFDVVTMPALRNRGSDLQLLAEHFAIKFAAESGWNHFPGLSTEALQHLFDHAWPGNVRELKNAIERSLHRQGDDSESEEKVGERVLVGVVRGGQRAPGLVGRAAGRGSARRAARLSSQTRTLPLNSSASVRRAWWRSDGT